MRLALATVLALALLAPPAAAQQTSVYHSPRLWATVNICDTEGHPDGIGIRGSMPGSGYDDEWMWMRFQVQYLRPSDGLWHNVATGDSGFVRVGSARIRRREAGRTFTVEPPPGGSWLLRGVVTFEWRRGGEVVRRARKRTTAGHRTRTAEPRGFSAATCAIS